MVNRVMSIASLLACLPVVVFCNTVTSDRANGIYAVYEGENALFTCIASSDITSDAIQWTLNGTRREHPVGLDSDVGFEAVSSRVGTLLIRNALADYDKTIVTCIISYTSAPLQATANATLRVQGLLDAVGGLNADFFERNSSLHLLWIPPSSLRVDDQDPVITYCVIVVNQTSNTIISSLSSCNRMETYFVVTDIDCVTVYEVIVTPVNPVGNGTSASVVFPDGIGNCDVAILGDMQTIEVSCNFIVMIMDILYAVTLQYTDLSGTRNNIDIRPSNIGDSDRSVIVEGLGNSLYCMTVFPVVNNSDLIRNAIVFRREFKLEWFATSMPTTAETTVAASTSTTTSIDATSISATSISATSSGTTPSSVIQSIPIKYIIPTVVVVVAILVVVILLVVIICCCCHLCKKREKTKSIAKNESPSPYLDAEVVVVKKIPQES